MDLIGIHEKIRTTIEVVGNRMAEVAKKIYSKESLYLLAKGEALVIAK